VRAITISGCCLVFFLIFLEVYSEKGRRVEVRKRREEKRGQREEEEKRDCRCVNKILAAIFVTFLGTWFKGNG